jgi:hypothetical protein
MQHPASCAGEQKGDRGCNGHSLPTQVWSVKAGPCDKARFPSTDSRSLRCAPQDFSGKLRRRFQGRGERARQFLLREAEGFEPLRQVRVASNLACNNRALSWREIIIDQAHERLVRNRLSAMIMHQRFIPI